MTSSQNKIIPLFKVFMSDSAPEEVGKVLMSGYIGQGPKVDEFEELLKDDFENDYVLTTNSGTSAHHLACKLIDLGHCDEVLTTPLTCTATNWPILMTGADIKWVDVDRRSCNMDLDDLARKLSDRTKAIVFVHWGGMPIDYTKLNQVLDNHWKLYGNMPYVIEDCAHAYGAEWDGKPISYVRPDSRTSYRYMFYSFQAIKHLTCIDGGALIVPGEKEYHRAKLLRWYGIDRETNRTDFRCEGNISEAGTKWHMNDVSATVGICNHAHMDWMLETQRENAQYYIKELYDSPDFDIVDYPEFNANPSWWLFTGFVDCRDDFMRKMKECGIITSRVHERNDKHSCVRSFRAQLPNLEEVCEYMICIPVGWWVTKEDREYIVDCIKKGW